MSKREYLQGVIERLITNKLKDLNVSLPAIVTVFNTDTQLATVQPAIQIKMKDDSDVSLPPIENVPVTFLGNSNFIIEHEVVKGDEVLLIFSQRCLDSWLDQGGVAPNPDTRMHDISDAIALFGLRSQKNKIAGFSNDGIKIRNKNNSSSVWLRANGEVEINADSIKVNGNLEVSGSVEADQIVAPSAIINGVAQETHIHTDSVGGSTSPPLPSTP